jgi:hypothetical protein
MVSGDKAELLDLLQWLKVFSLSNRNLGQAYDPVNRRDGKEPRFNFVEKIISRNQYNVPFKSSANKENLGGGAHQYILDPKTIQKLAQYDVMKAEREFYYGKLKDIDHVLDVYRDSSVDMLIQTIKDIIYLSPDKIGIVSEEGRLVVKGDKETMFNEQQNIKANFQEGSESELNHYSFGENINLMTEKMDFESLADN